MAEMSLDCTACGKKFRVNFAVKPKQVPCPQCKAKVSTEAVAGSAPAPAEEKPADPKPAEGSAPAPAPAAGKDTAPAATNSATPAADASAKPPAKATADTSAKPPAKAAAASKPARAAADNKTQAPKPKRLPTLLRTEDVEFKGWSYDHEAEQARGGLQKTDVMGIIWIAGVVFMFGVMALNLHRRLHTKTPGIALMVIGGVGIATALYLFLKLRAKGDGSTCARCRGVLGAVETQPTERDCKARNYTRGASGGAYKMAHGKLWEVRKKWHTCKACRKYFVADKEVLDFVGPGKGDMEKREALYAEAAAAAAAPKPAAPATPAPAASTPAAAPATSAPAATPATSAPAAPATPASAAAPAATAGAETTPASAKPAAEPPAPRA
jgi:hypothetical protein